ncbi:phosphoglycolate phosphatase [Rubrivivax benzoatilyticus]|uniref:phosphoglycolate phosphatase n=1 Tax=Rubrivivax benzoatilyticus TaxID=316997 RepID=A0ABX0HT35_9BURK|nr:phosphoglycolate phosphatase [Rubrivivax benzoatilyticus]EGJ11949.1 phosphoglycolate phosphatase [Rubrivivax benzoatilyticus JA2 = ATCC BAA-35]NHK97471.1 phosphoglycolate phosphatase [Rubrivivax benzoatilyticus]NHL22834.1 phosphoglycolate phosphatase [Rubrivivax benzoatilyticus]
MARAEVVLFDLDGTLVDSAPDLAGAANDLRIARGLAPLPYERLRPMVGTGARGMVGAAFGLAPGDEGFEPLRDAFLARYAERLLQATCVFEHVEPVLAALDGAGLRWGIVTNKAMRYAEPVVRGLALQARAAALIAGDTTPHAKPHPEPLWEAARRLGVAPERCVYVGDDHRDIVAGRAAGMHTLAAGWGYLGCGEPIHAWGADAVLEEPFALLNWLDLA